jgi:hypothetical protein
MTFMDQIYKQGTEAILEGELDSHLVMRNTLKLTQVPMFTMVIGNIW